MFMISRCAAHGSFKFANLEPGDSIKDNPSKCVYEVVMCGLKKLWVALYTVQTAHILYFAMLILGEV